MRVLISSSLFLVLGLCAACGDDDSTPDAPRIDAQVFDADPTPDALPPQTTCDPLAQDCLSPDTPKCTIVCEPVSTCAALGTECVEDGTKAESESCTRSPSSGNASVGHDDCAAGMFCSGRGFDLTQVPPVRACRAFCRADADCTIAGEKCMTLTETDGICLPVCTMFATDQCDAGLWCGIGTDFNGELSVAKGECQVAGTQAIGADCGAEIGNCVEGAVCMGDGKCHQLCSTDGVNGCTATGETCQPIQDALDVGFCAAG